MSSRGKLIAATASGGLLVVALFAMLSPRSAPTASSDGNAAEAAEAPTATYAETARVSGDAPGELVVYRSPGCVCCERWADHMRENGFDVRVEEPGDLVEVKRDHGVSRTLSSCHTAVVDGYVIEGHVPADVVRRLLDERPDVTGVAVPGMPIGSPGMEGPNPESYDIFTFDGDGEISIYARR